MTHAYIGIGSNTTNPRRHLRHAERLLARLPGARLAAVSPHYGTAPVGCPGRQPPYRNAVARLQTPLPPQRLFRRLRQLEQRVQRQKRRQNAPRRLDVDYLFHGRARLRGKFLTLPHPRATQRAFVLQPLADLLAHPPAAAFLLPPAAVRQALAQCAAQPLWRLS